MLIIQDLIITAEMSNGNPVGEAHSNKSTEGTLSRLYGTISNLMDDAQTTYDQNALHPDSNEINLNYVTRLSTNEFFFYTKELLTLAEFEKLQNQIADKAKKMSSGVQLILGSFAVVTEDGMVMNVTPYISCGEYPDFYFIVKNYTSSIDVRYKTTNRDGDLVSMPFFDIRTGVSMPSINIGEMAEKFRFTR